MELDPSSTLTETPRPAERIPGPSTEVRVESQDRPPVGVNRWIAIASMITVYVTATLFVLVGKADAIWWGQFCSITLLGSLGITLGGSAVIKTAEAIRK